MSEHQFFILADKAPISSAKGFATWDEIASEISSMYDEIIKRQKCEVVLKSDSHDNCLKSGSVRALLCMPRGYINVISKARFDELNSA